MGMNDNHYSKPQEWVSRVFAAVGVEVTDKVADWLGFHMERWLALAEDGAGFGIGPQPELVARFFSSNGFAAGRRAALLRSAMPSYEGRSGRQCPAMPWAKQGRTVTPRRKRRGYGAEFRTPEKPAL